MKKVLLSGLFAVALAFGSYAQRIETVPQTSENVGMAPIQQGNWMVGGSVGSLGYSFEGKNFNIQVNPRAGYFISDGIAIGAQAALGLDAISGEDNVWNYGIAPFVRYYFPEGSSSTGRFFGHGNVGIGGSSRGDGASFEAGIAGGYAHFITRNVALETTLGYNYSKANLNSSGGASGLGVSVGFQIYLPGRAR
ncbi:hypothetical protein [Sphingobacterium corticibacter]|uniref:Outer membrane protein beta-barrel domain-containing protein n=1 Tax=Sphingobacterium corticibacter TaxID=2171749 RepID=A0A2T8HLU5_9SPHI|nr:hypothetical protein [Sphingobacterium corticibacter]PVH26405.1 hypothetical protein DC487_01940 [Sphingobacterium corticibacter]